MGWYSFVTILTRVQYRCHIPMHRLIALQAAEFGTDHIYQTDAYNELRPSRSDEDYLAAASASLYHAMSQADPRAVWLMQVYSETICTQSFNNQSTSSQMQHFIYACLFSYLKMPRTYNELSVSAWDVSGQRTHNQARVV